MAAARLAGGRYPHGAEERPEAHRRGCSGEDVRTFKITQASLKMRRQPQMMKLAHIIVSKIRNDLKWGESAALAFVHKKERMLMHEVLYPET